MLIFRPKSRLNLFRNVHFYEFILISMVVLFCIAFSYPTQPNFSLASIKTYPPFKEKFTILIPTHQTRSTRVKTQIDLIGYGQSKYIDSIYLYWIDKNNSMPQLKTLLNSTNKTTVPIYLIQSPHNNIMDRFNIPPNISTRTVLSMDDDIKIDGNVLDKLFEKYLINNFQNRIFGQSDRKCTKTKYSYVYPKRKDYKYNLVLTNFAFLDISMLEAIHLPKYKELTTYVGNNMNCEDILMNYVATDIYRTSPVSINFKIPINVPGISSHPDHLKKRSVCCQMFEEFFAPDFTQESYFINRRMQFKSVLF